MSSPPSRRGIERDRESRRGHCADGRGRRTPIVTAVASRQLTGADKIGLRLGKVIDKWKMAKHFDAAVTNSTLVVERRQGAIDAEAALDGIYVLRTTLREDEMDAPGVVAAHKELAHVERDFHHIKVDDISLRPIHHRLEARVRANVFICMMAAYLVWHLREALAPLTFTDEHPPTRENPVTPAVRSASASTKAATKRNETDEEVRGFRELLVHLGTLTRNTVRVATDTTNSFELLSTLTPTQRRVFELLGAPVPRRLK